MKKQRDNTNTTGQRAMHLPQDAYVRLNLVRLIPAIYIVARCRMAIGNFGQRWCFTKRVLVGGFTGPDLFDRNLWLSQWPWLETTCGYRASPGSDGLSQALPKLRPLQMAKGRPGNRAALLPEFDSRVIVGPTAFLATLRPLFILVQQLSSLRSGRCLYPIHHRHGCAVRRWFR